MFVLVLNDMRDCRVEMTTMVCRSETETDMLALLERETVEVYRDPKHPPYWLENPRSGAKIEVIPGIEEGWWGKSFRKGGPLEWYNQPCQLWGQRIRDAEALARDSGCRFREEIEDFIERVWMLPDAVRL
jgi:hypothetical protein